MQDFKLYVILDKDVCSKYGDIVEIARQTILGGADILQLRAKGSPDRKILKIGQATHSLVQKSKALFVLNDRTDLAQTIGADGVHLGQKDLPVKDARDLLGNNKIIGVSTHSVDQALEAQRQGADYIAIGPIFPTATKPETKVLTPAIITKIKDKVNIPFVAVGGINLDNLGQVLSLGAERVAICQGIVSAKDVFNVTSEFRQRLYGRR